MRTAFISPIENKTNNYIELQKLILQSCNYKTKKLSLRTLLSKEIFELLDKNNLLIFHWIENRAFKHSELGPRISTTGLLSWAIYYLLCKFTRAQTVYFIHNHSVHDTAGIRKAVSRLLIDFFASSTTMRVVHDPSMCKKFKAAYIPHPLYWDENTERRPKLQQSNPPKTSIIGAIRPYKRIESTLSNWPQGKRLEILGHGEKTYVKKLSQIIENRALGNWVTIQNKFLSNIELDEAIRSTDVLLLPHDHASMLVSGMFFEGIGRVPVIMARETPFTKWASTETASVITFTNDSELDQAIALSEHALRNIPPEEPRAFATREFGWSRCIEAYKSLFN